MTGGTPISGNLRSADGRSADALRGPAGHTSRRKAGGAASHGGLRPATCGGDATDRGAFVWCYAPKW